MGERLDTLLRGLRRFAVLTVVVIAGTSLASAAIGLVLGAGPRRAVSVGLYLVGSGCVVLAFFASTRPPVRTEDEDRPRGLGGMFVSLQGTARFKTPDERRETQAISWVLISVGIVVVLVATLVDGRHNLV